MHLRSSTFPIRSSFPWQTTYIQSVCTSTINIYILETFSGEENTISRVLYVDFGLPWSVSPAVSGFEKDSREEFTVDAVGFLEMALGTVSQFTR
jgi:hypothetical protein